MRRKMQPDISVVVLFYNSEKFVRECLDSLVAQQGISMQIVIVNDGSTDSTAAICHEYIRNNPNIKFSYIYQENQGIPVAKQRGLNAAQGKYFATVDGDDYIGHTDGVSIDPYYYRNVLDAMTHHDADLARTGAYCTVDRFNIKYNTNTVLTNAWGKIGLKRIFTENPPLKELRGQWRYVAKMDLLRKYNFKYISQTLGNDIHFVVNMCVLSSRLVECPGQYFYRIHDQSVTNKPRPLSRVLWLKLCARMDLIPHLFGACKKKFLFR
jgi:glycosyltransferase involved in cell wall biosynthesis